MSVNDRFSFARSLERDFSTLAESPQFAVALMLCERMMPRLDLFSQEEQYDAEAYRECLNGLWQLLAIGDRSVLNRHGRPEPPDSEQYRGEYAREALNATLSIDHAIAFAETHQIVDLLEISEMAYDNVYAHLECDVSASTEHILMLPAMVMETRQQQALIAAAKQLPIHITPSDTIRLRYWVSTLAEQ